MSKEKKGYDEKKAYKRDTIAMISVLTVLFLAPVGITFYENYKNANASDPAIETNIDEQTLEEMGMVATPSNAPETSADEENPEAAADEEAVTEQAPSSEEAVTEQAPSSEEAEE